MKNLVREYNENRNAYEYEERQWRRWHTKTLPAAEFQMLARLMSRHFNVRCPKVQYATIRYENDNYVVSGYYDPMRISIDRKWGHIAAFLHEFAHHLHYELGGYGDDESHGAAFSRYRDIVFKTAERTQLFRKR